MNKGGVEVGSYTLEHNAKEVVVGLQNALLHGKALHMLDALGVLQDSNQRVVNHYRHVGCSRLLCIEVGHLYMAAKSSHLVAYGMFESKHNTHAQYHNRQSYSHSSRSYAYGRF